ncbi:MAG TPA: hypothetical protein VD841_06370 [Arthrobacter sp.]|nr:hypothetical protein [Arthrobacter sp.]
MASVQIVATRAKATADSRRLQAPRHTTRALDTASRKEAAAD